MPTVRFEQPGPSKNIARPDPLHNDRLTSDSLYLQANTAAANHVKTVRDLAFVKEHLPRVKMGEHGAVRQEAHVARTHPFHEGMFGNCLFQRGWHHARLSRTGGPLRRLRTT